jgi:hypothetical protein
MKWKDSFCQPWLKQMQTSGMHCMLLHYAEDADTQNAYGKISCMVATPCFLPAARETK